MFEDTINNVLHTKNNFSDNVRDAFGSSIVDDILSPLESEEQSLHNEYEAAELKMAQIKATTMELRLIV